MPEDRALGVIDFEVRVADDAVEISEQVVLEVDIERADASDGLNALLAQADRLLVIPIVVGC